ncbi:MAG TPA: translocation/assembly module TamB domain-containing protein [Allosphingosinicella sp.]
MPEGEVRIVRHRGRSIAKWAAIVIGLLLLAAATLVLGLNTEFGRRYVVRQIDNLEMASGLDIDVGRIEGNLYGDLIVHDLVLRDPKGVFFAAPRVELDWRPFSYFRNHIDIRSATIPQAGLFRLPELRPSGNPNAPLLPDIDIDIGRLRIDRLAVHPAVTGRRHLLSLTGGAKIADGRAQIALDAGAIAARGLAGGDRLQLRLDGAPDENRFDVAARLKAPADGFVAGLAGLEAPLDAQIGGKGTWKAWQGRAQAMLGGKGLADLNLAGRDGRFTVTGPVRPNLVLRGPLARLTAPLVQLNLITSLDNRRADTDLRLNSPAAAIAMKGMIDLGQSRFEDVRVAARLMQPGAIAPNLRANDLRLAMVLNGGFGTPQVAYRLNARTLGFDETVVEGLAAEGRARVDTDRILIPVSARAARISGLNPALGGLLTNVSLGGTFAIGDNRVLSDDLRIRSDKLNATAIVVADLARGRYTGAIQGRVNNYLLEGIGIVDLDTNLDVVSTVAGLGVQGRVAVKTRRIDISSARDMLGGNAVASANIRMNPDGMIAFSNVRLSAPQLRITSGEGTYAPNGRINLRAIGTSTQYGPLAVVVTGAARQPLVRLRAARPGFGIGLSDVDATIRGTGQGYAITASGQSQYGPFSADVTILSGRGPLRIDVGLVRFAGIDFRGVVTQTAAGPFAGQLSMAGSGLSGTVRLAAAGRYQQAQVSARANGARIPGEQPILIQRGIIEAAAILYPSGPSITGDAQLAGVRSGQFSLARARARAQMQGGTGRAQIFAEGSSGTPFTIAANAAITPNRILAALQGRANNIPFRLERPADLRKVAGGWQLAPATLVLPQGNVRLAGRFGSGLIVQARMANLDLSVANAFAPGLGLGGKATGALDFAQPSGATFPRADLRVNIDDFTRTGIATLSAPVDIAAAGTLRPEGGALNAVIRRGGPVIGRLQARLQPLSPAAGSWMQRLLASPLSGGIRYNGPAEVLWSLTGLSDQQVSGPLGLAADFGGRVQRPQLTGVVKANNLTFVDETYGTRLTNMAVQGRFTSSRLELAQINARAGRGTISGRGVVDLAADAGFPVDVELTLNRAQLARSDALGATVSGKIAVTNGPGRPALISGDLQLPEARYQFIRQGAAEVAVLEGVHRRGEPVGRPEDEEGAGPPSIWNLDLRVRADNEVFVSGMGLESEWQTDLRVTGTTSAPSVTGTAEVIRGTYSFAGREFDITRGRIDFTGGRRIDPQLDLSATTDVENITATINITGSSSNPQIALTSSPALPQDEIMARLFFGGSVTDLSALQAVQLAASLNSLRGGGGGLNPLGKLRSAGGISRLRILGSDAATGRGTAIAAGFYVSNDIYLEVITDARGFTATQLEIALSKALSLLSTASSAGSSSVNVRYRKDY